MILIKNVKHVFVKYFNCGDFGWFACGS